MAKNTIEDLRNHLFETLEALKDSEKPMEPQRARAVCEVAQAIINSAKVEIQFLDATGIAPAGRFFPAPGDEKQKAPRLVSGE